MPFNVNAGNYLTTTITGSSNSQRPVSLYHEARTGSASQSRSGVQTTFSGNGWNFSMDIHFGLTETGITFSTTNRGGTQHGSSYLDLTAGQFVFETGNTTNLFLETSITSYTNATIGNYQAWGALALAYGGYLAAPLLAPELWPTLVK
jgi:hypothetical protein